MKLFLLVLCLLPATLARVCRDAPFFNCQNFVAYCNTPSMRPTLERNCRKTCRFCKVIPTSKPSDCKDLSTAKCAYFLNAGYCNKLPYRTYMRRNCPKSCGLCTGNPTTSPSQTIQPPATPNPGTGSCGIPSVASGRVIGGKTARAGAWPWQILMEYSGRAGCGGSLVSNQWVVTAAHCVDGKESNPSRFTIILGEHDRNVDEGSEQRIHAEKVITNPGYSKSTFDGDIALIKLSRPAIINDRVKPVCLPQQRNPLPSGTNCFITGFGKTSASGRMHHVLQQAAMPTIDSKTCDQFNKRQMGFFFPTITNNMLCAGDAGKTTKNGCQGDSGGPFVCQTGPNNAFELHGVVSFGSQQCSSAMTYSIFARVTELRSWIEQTMSRN